jgi:hypothetical protein
MPIPPGQKRKEILGRFRSGEILVAEQNNLHDRDVVLIMPVTVKAEILSIALQKNWGERKYNLVKKMFDHLQ